MEQTTSMKPNGVPRTTLALDEAGTDEQSEWQGLIAPEPFQDSDILFKKNAESFLLVAYDIVNKDIVRQEAKLMDLRRKRQEMVASAQALGIKIPAPTY